MVDGSTGSGQCWDKVDLHSCHHVARDGSNERWIKALLDSSWKTRGKHSSLTGVLWAQVRRDHEPPQRRLTMVNGHGCRGVEVAFFALFKEGVWQYGQGYLYGADP